MSSINAPATSAQLYKYQVTRRGRKLQLSDDQRTLVALPKDVPERIWVEILQKEETDMMILDIREEILDEALKIGYERYMERQNVYFTADCAARAWLKLIDWYFYRHDPGEDSSAYPQCYIPNRNESWIPDKMPETSPKDTWAKEGLTLLEEMPEEVLQKWPSTTSLEMPLTENIPSEFWFPGKVNLPERRRKTYEEATRALIKHGELSSLSLTLRSTSSTSLSTTERNLNAESEVIQKVIDYSTEEVVSKESQVTSHSEVKTSTSVEGSIHGAGDSVVDRYKSKPKKSKVFSRSKVFSQRSVQGKSRANLPPLDDSYMSVVSDCRLRNLRMDTQFDILSEKVESVSGVTSKKK